MLDYERRDLNTQNSYQLQKDRLKMFTKFIEISVLFVRYWLTVCFSLDYHKL